MSKESMNLGEAFQATKLTHGAPDIKPRHSAIGWSVVVALLAALGFGGTKLYDAFVGGGSSLHEKAGFEEQFKQKLIGSPGMKEILGHKFGGVLYLDIIRSVVNTPRFEWENPFAPKYENTHFGPIPNTIVNEGENVLEDCFENNTGTACTNVANFEFHGIGTSSAAIAETDGGCTTELTTQYNPDNTRATGSQTNNGANVYRTVGTNTVDSAATIEEFCLMDVNTGAGNMWTRILTGTIALGSGDGLQTTYDLTIE